MGTNYYVKTEQCGSCSHNPEDIHIGKSSMGWAFGLRIHESLGIAGFDDWVAFLNKNADKIINEYGDSVLVADVLSTITKRSRPERDAEDLKRVAATMRPYCAADTKNGLLRHVREGVWYDENVTYDICDYDFC